jgi:hypothetical protein
MSWSSLPTDVREIAERVLTQKQLEAWKLELRGMGIRPIAFELDVTPRVITDRLARVHQLLLKTGVRQDEFGKWTIDEEVAA